MTFLQAVLSNIMANEATNLVTPARNGNSNTGVSAQRTTLPVATPQRPQDTMINRAVMPSRSIAVVSGGNTPSSGAGATGAQNNQPYWSEFSPFQLLADVYRNTFGNSYPVVPTGQQQIVPVPVGESGGSGGNSLMILLILAGAGFAVWYFYFRN
jgi:hypothetical protein